jgi:hypothetical protein
MVFSSVDDSESTAIGRRLGFRLLPKPSNNTGENIEGDDEGTTGTTDIDRMGLVAVILVTTRNAFVDIAEMTTTTMLTMIIRTTTAVLRKSGTILLVR